MVEATPAFFNNPNKNDNTATAANSLKRGLSSCDAQLMESTVGNQDMMVSTLLLLLNRE